MKLESHIIIILLEFDPARATLREGKNTGTRHTGRVVPGLTGNSFSPSLLWCLLYYYHVMCTVIF